MSWRLSLETTPGCRLALHAIAAAALGAIAGARAGAQDQLSAIQPTVRTLVRVAVRDSLGAPVANATITVLRGLHDTVATATTDASGAWALFVPRERVPVQVVARKIGYARAESFASVAGRDSVSVALAMRRLVTQLATVRIT